MPFISPTREALTAKFHAPLDEGDHVADHALFGKNFDDLEEFFLIFLQQFGAVELLRAA